MRRPVYLLVCLLLAAGCDDSDKDSGTGTGGSEPAGLSLNEGGNTVLVDETWKECATSDDCVRVWTSCDGCCGEEAVTASRQDEYSQGFSGLCEGYMGGVCDCAPLPSTIECVDSVCTLVPSDE